MSIGVCVFCGNIKQGAYTPCDCCKNTPLSETDLAYSIALSSHYMPLDVLRGVSSEMLRGRPRVVLPPEQLEHFKNVAREWMAGDVFQMLVGSKNNGLRHSTAFPKPPARSRTFISNIAIGYLAIGGLLGSIMYASYIWPYTLGSSRHMPQASFLQKSVALVVVQPFAVFSCVVRAVTWGPSLAIWSSDPMGYSFGRWVAPGLFEEYKREREAD